MWDLSSLTRDRTHLSCLGSMEAWSPIHWTTREVPEDISKMLQYPIKKYFNISSNSVAFVKNSIF